MQQGREENILETFRKSVFTEHQVSIVLTPQGGLCFLS